MPDLLLDMLHKLDMGSVSCEFKLRARTQHMRVPKSTEGSQDTELFTFERSQFSKYSVILPVGASINKCTELSLGVKKTRVKCKQLREGDASYPFYSRVIICKYWNSGVVNHI